MPAAQIDLLKYSCSLQEAGIPARHAEAHAAVLQSALTDMFENNLKDFLRTSDLLAFESKFDARLAKFEKRIELMTERFQSRTDLGFERPESGAFERLISSTRQLKWLTFATMLSSLLLLAMSFFRH